MEEKFRKTIISIFIGPYGLYVYHTTTLHYLGVSHTMHVLGSYTIGRMRN